MAKLITETSFPDSQRILSRFGYKLTKVGSKGGETHWNHETEHSVHISPNGAWQHVEPVAGSDERNTIGMGKNHRDLEVQLMSTHPYYHGKGN
jgi:hypothetical protein